MISRKKLDEQLKRINFHYNGWGRSEVAELATILMPDEEIEECVNGYYEAGFALLASTKDRLLLVDKKPLGYLTVEDLRFDMINELDLHHRLLGAQIRISAGSKTLLFTSLNQVRLRRLLNYVQTRMTKIKKDTAAEQADQKRHLEEMNEQLKLYLMAAHKQQFVDRANQLADKPASGHEAYLSEHESPQPALDGGRADKAADPPHASGGLAQSHGSGASPDDQQRQPALATRTAVYTPQSVSSASAFEQAAAQAIGAELKEQAVTPAPAEPPTLTQKAFRQAEQFVFTPQQVGIAAARRVIPVISAYSRLPLISQRRRYYGDSRPHRAL